MNNAYLQATERLLHRLLQKKDNTWIIKCCPDGRLSIILITPWCSTLIRQQSKPLNDHTISDPSFFVKDIDNFLSSYFVFLLIQNYIRSSSSRQMRTQASLGMRRSPLGDNATDPTFGPSGTQDRLNCWAKNIQ